MPGGRPSIYNEELAEEICDRLAEGESLRSIVKDWYMPCHKTIYRWIDENPAFGARYAKARERQAHALAERAAAMAAGTFEGTDPAFARLQLDALKWMTGKLAPKHYGDKVDVSVGGQEGGTPVATVIKWEK
jgi:hypothetical protein